jgi:PAS domain S-box-containing protein
VAAHAAHPRSLSIASVVAVVVAVGLLAAGLSLAAYNEDLGRVEKLRDVTVQADILSGSVAAALAFDDARVAQEYLDALGANQDVEAAGVYDPNGKLVAGYARPGAAPPATDSAHAPALQGDHVVVSRPVVQSGAKLGSVYLRTVREPFARRAPRYGGIAMLVVMAALMLVVLGASNASLVKSHRQLKVEMAERAKTEQALRRSQEMEAQAQLEIVAERSRAAVRQSEQQLEFALRAGRLGSWAIDLKSGALQASEFFLANFGLGPQEAPADTKGLDRYIHPEDRDSLREVSDRATRDAAELETEYRTVGPDGQVRWILVRGRAVYDDDGTALRMTGVSMDTTARMREQTERQAIEEQLRQAQKVEAIGQLTGGVAHDFNNLLGVIVGNLDMLQDLVRSDPEGSELAQSALNAALRGAELTKRLLAVARQQPLAARVIDLNERLPGIVAMLQRTLGENIHLNTRLGDGLWAARADPSQVEDTLLNLAINARDAMPDGGTLTIETGNVTLDEHFAASRTEITPGDYVMLSVTDTGVGMAPEVIARATEPFFTTKPAGKGTGLGLSMIYGFAKQSGGHLSIYSEVGVGTTMRLFLPKAQTEEAGVEGARPTAATLSGGGESILVVDDNHELRQVSVRRLTRLGYRCREADNGPRALALLEAGERFDLLFTDIGLPDGISGYELAKLAGQRQPRLKVLFTTGYAKVHSRDGEEPPESDDMLRKPYRSEELAGKVRAILDARSQAA